MHTQERASPCTGFIGALMAMACVSQRGEHKVDANATKLQVALPPIISDFRAFLTAPAKAFNRRICHRLPSSLGPIFQLVQQRGIDFRLQCGQSPEYAYCLINEHVFIYVCTT